MASRYDQRRTLLRGSRARCAAPANGRAHLEPHPYLLERGFPAEAILEAGWRVERLGDRYRRYGLADHPAATEAEVWVIPYLHANGQVWFERIRFIHAEDLERFGGGKYRQPARKQTGGQGLALYDPYLVLGLETFTPLDSLLLVEGEANTVAVHTLLPELAVVGLPGQKALTAKTAEQLRPHPRHLPVDRPPRPGRRAERPADRRVPEGRR